MPPRGEEEEKTQERPPEPDERHAPQAEGAASGFLYDADGDDRAVDLDAEAVADLDEDDLLWMDFRVDPEEAFRTLDELLGTALSVHHLSAREAQPSQRPMIRDYGEYFSLRVLPLGDDAGSDSPVLTCAVGRNWLATIHERELPAIREFGDHLRGDSVVGRLDAPSFLARLLEWVVNGYFDELDRLQASIDDIEERILRERGRGEEVGTLVALRHDIGRLRRRLSPHRQVFSTLAHPSFDVISGTNSAREYEILSDRLEMAVEMADKTREMVVGAFDVFMTQTAQRTNDIMKVLATVSLLLLPATLIAGTLGMNMLPKYLLHSWIFWAALVLMVVVSGVLYLAMRLRRWL